MRPSVNVDIGSVWPSAVPLRGAFEAARDRPAKLRAVVLAVASGWFGAASVTPGADHRSAAAHALAGSSAPGAPFETVILPHLDAAYTLARFLTRDADAADDVVQEAFLRAFRAFDGYRGGDARAWLLAIVRNCARSWAAERNRARATSRSLPETAEPGTSPEADVESGEIWDADQDDPEMALMRVSEANLIRRLVEALPDAFREVLVLREFDDLSYKQIAEITATPMGTVMSRLARARAMLGAAWRRQGGERRA